LLVEGAHRLGFTLTQRQIEQFQLYYDLLMDWNSRINLTAITAHDAVQVRHFVDSLTVGAALLSEMGADQPPAGLKLLDVGTGAGFPGLPLKIVWPKAQVVLADSISKKTTFLKAVSEALGLTGLEVITTRAEELGRSKAHRQQYTAVTARAVAALPVLCEYCLPLVRVGGWMLASKKGDISRELNGALGVTKILGGERPKLHPFILPGEEEERYVVAVRKVRPTPPGYPRRVGVAKSRPLGTG